ncbi:MAG: hypothetical protein R3F21_02515 [Myxococcota bacterium]
MFGVSLRSTPSRRTLARILLAGSAALCLASSAQAQIVIGGSTINLRTDANVVSSELSRHLPASGVRKYSRYVGFLRWETVHTLAVMAETKQGISSRTWKSDTRKWSDWVHHGNPLGAPIERISGSGDSPGIDTGLTMIPGFVIGGNDWMVHQGVGLPTTIPTLEVDFKTGLHQIDPITRTLVAGQSVPNFSTVTAGGSSALPANFRHFNPLTSLTSPSPRGGSAVVRHVFGTGVPRGHVRSSRFAGANIPLVELRRDHDSQSPSWINHGVPSGATGVDVGPGSATSVIHDYLSAPNPVDREEQRYVFVSTNPAEDGYGDGLNGDVVAYRRTNSQGDAWHSLGSVGGLVYGAPLAIPYYTGVPIAGGLGRIVVFAVARNGNGDYVLKSRFHNGHGWDSSWQHWGAPASLGGVKFKLTSAVVYWNGAPNQMANLRISAFGYSEQDSGPVGQLIEFHWDGASWRFAAPRTAPNGQTFRTTHSSVIEDGTRDRIVVVGRTSGGRIYEFAREIDGGQVVSETWTDLSYEPLVFRTPTF